VSDETDQPAPRGGWVEKAPRAAHYQVVGTSALSNIGALPVIAFAYQTLDGQTLTTSMIMTEDSLKEWKRNSLRAYDEALRQVRILKQSIAEQAKEDESDAG
jgi:hypothetical protein